jgi:hypothetical protein
LAKSSSEINKNDQRVNEVLIVLGKSPTPFFRTKVKHFLIFNNKRGDPSLALGATSIILSCRTIARHQRPILSCRALRGIPRIVRDGVPLHFVLPRHASAERPLACAQGDISHCVFPRRPSAEGPLG